MEYSISEDQNTMVVDGTQYLAVKAGHECDGCAFGDTVCKFANEYKDPPRAACAIDLRKDHKSIVWIKATNNEPPTNLDTRTVAELFVLADEVRLNGLSVTTDRLFGIEFITVRGDFVRMDSVPRMVDGTRYVSAYNKDGLLLDDECVIQFIKKTEI